MRTKYKAVEPRTPTDFEALYRDFRDNKSMSKSTATKYEIAVKHLRKYCEQEYGTSNLHLLDFNVRLLVRFRLWLLRQTLSQFTSNSEITRCISPATADQYVDGVITIFRYGDRMEFLEKFPFKNYEASLPATLKHGSDALDRKVSKDDLGKIENTNIGVPYLERTRKLFLLQRWTGMAWIDLNHYGRRIKDLVKTDLSQRPVIEYNRVKTGEVAIIPFFPETRQLLEALGWDASPGKYRRYRDNILRLFKFLEISCDGIGSHSGRHVFGSEMLETGFTMESVSRMMGHSTTEETQKVYAKINREKIFADMERVKKVQDVFQMVQPQTQPQ